MNAYLSLACSPKCVCHMALITVLIHQRTAAINCLGAGLTCQLAVQSNGSLFQMHNKWRLCSRKGPDRKNELLPHGCNFLSNCGSCAWDVGCVEGDTIYTVRCLARKPLLRRIATWKWIKVWTHVSTLASPWLLLCSSSFTFIFALTN